MCGDFFLGGEVVDGVRLTPLCCSSGRNMKIHKRAESEALRSLDPPPGGRRGPAANKSRIIRLSPAGRRRNSRICDPSTPVGFFVSTLENKALIHKCHLLHNGAGKTELALFINQKNGKQKCFTTASFNTPVTGFESLYTESPHFVHFSCKVSAPRAVSGSRYMHIASTGWATSGQWWVVSEVLPFQQLIFQMCCLNKQVDTTKLKQEAFALKVHIS